MSITTHLLQRATQLLSVGKVDDARLVITAVLKEEPTNADAWYYWQQTLPETRERAAILEKVLHLDPDHIEARQALDQIRQEPASPAVVVAVEAVAEPTAQLERYQLAVMVLSTALITVFVCLVYFLIVDSGNMQSLAGRYRTLEQKYKTGVADINNLTNRNETLQSEKQQMQSQFDQLDNQFSALTTEHNQLQTVYTALESRYNDMVIQYQELNGRYTALQQEHNSLIAAYNSLNGQYTNLQVAHSQAVQENEWLNRVGVFPPYIQVTEERNVELVFYRSDRRINSWVISMDALAADIVRGNRDRNNILKAIFNRVYFKEIDGDVSYPDFREFVDPTPFYPYVASIYNDSVSDDAFIRELWYITTQLMTYNFEMEETPRYPLETFLAGGGDCEDTSILLASM